MIKAKIEDRGQEDFLKSLPDDSKDVYLLSGGQVRLTLVSATHIVNQMKANQRTGLLETYVLGQAYIAGLLLTSTIKGDDRVQLTIECGGPIKGISVEAWAAGAVRGYLMENPIHLSTPLKSLDTSLLFGPGFLTVSRVLEGSKEPVSGTVMLQYGNIAKDLAVYFDESEQTPTLFYISLFSRKAEHLGDLGEAISRGQGGDDYIAANFADYGAQKLSSSFVAFSCPCTREHFQSYLAKLPAKEKEEILAGAFPLVLECFNCGTTYSFTRQEVESLFDTEDRK